MPGRVGNKPAKLMQAIRDGKTCPICEVEKATHEYRFGIKFCKACLDDALDVVRRTEEKDKDYTRKRRPVLIEEE
jgi:hypothetical protein